MKDQQLVNLLKQVGFKGRALQTAFGVAKAESGGRPTAHNPDASTGDNSYGLFQINMLGSMGPARRQQFGLKSNEDLFDPVKNAKIAYRMSGGGTNWQPWTTFTSGLYREPAARAPKPNGVRVPRPGGGPQRQRARRGTVPGAPPLSGLQEPAFRIPKFKFTGGIDPTGLANRLLSGMNASEAIAQATTPFEVHEIVQKVPRLPKPVAEVKARKYGGTVQDADPSGNFGPTGAANPAVARAINIAKQQIGKPYVWAASSPGVGFDCSGLIEYAFEAAGIKTPGRLTTGPMAKMGAKVPWKNVQPGDWIVRDSGGSGHVVMYVGGGQVIAAPRTGEVVQYQPLSRFSSDSRYAVRRWHGGE